MQKLTSAQNKIIIAVIIVIGIFLLFWAFVYSPSRGNLARIKSELAVVESQLRQIETMFDQSKGREEGIRALKEKFQELNDKFPAKEEEGFTMLSDFAKNMNIELASVKMQPKTDLLDENNAKIEIEGKTCQVVAVNIEMRCYYKDLVGYLEALRISSPVFNVIEGLSVSKDPSGSARLNVSLNLDMYLLN